MHVVTVPRTEYIDGYGIPKNRNHLIARGLARLAGLPCFSLQHRSDPDSDRDRERERERERERLEVGPVPVPVVARTPLPRPRSPPDSGGSTGTRTRTRTRTVETSRRTGADMDVDVHVEIDVDMATDSGAPPASGPAPSTPASAGSPGALKLAEPRRRNRPALSCIQCRTRKIRCDRNEPCASCMKSKIVNCTYEEARRPKPRLWRLSPAPAGHHHHHHHHHHSEHSPTSADERTTTGSAFTFRDMAVSAAPPPTSNPSGPSSGPAPPPGRTPDPLSAPSPHALLPLTHLADSACGAAGPLGTTTALADRVRQLEQQLADALRRSDYASPSSSRSAHATLSPDHCRSSRPYGAGSLTNGDKLVGRSSQILRCSPARFPPWQHRDSLSRPLVLPLVAG